MLVKRAAEALDEVESVQIRLYESTESADPISQWSPEVSFDEAISNPRVYRNGKFRMEKRFAELEKFRFPEPIGNANVVLAAQDEVTTLPYYIPMRNMDVKIGGNEFDRLRRWYKQGKLSKSRGMQKKNFPQTSSPRMIAKLIRQGVLQNARFAAAVLVTGIKRGRKEDTRLLIRTDCAFPTLYQIRQQGSIHHAGSLCHRARGRAVHQIFPRGNSRVCLRRKCCRWKCGAQSSPVFERTA